ncbi:hypothetical protein GCM10012278_40970 [Nonomuraea glycinis]|uniref:Uncharacterized protein n=1 Tax=Nonomuraea glycinis TaxID=2047744 RepID=A0A918E6M4_9ACTN|nr:hypothetical protein GCM10012278_40970 [Nonomuraea glycinis]
MIMMTFEGCGRFGLTAQGGHAPPPTAATAPSASGAPVVRVCLVHARSNKARGRSYSGGIR